MLPVTLERTTHENLNQRTIRLTHAAGSGTESGGRLRFAERHCPAAGRFEKISGADRSTAEQIQYAPHQPRLSGRLPALQGSGGVYCRRGAPHHRGRPCTSGMSANRCGGLSPCGTVPDDLCVGRTV